MLHPDLRRSRIPIVDTLVLAIVALAVISALAGLFWPGGDGPSTITTYRGQQEDIFGHGIYRDSSAFNGAAARGTDVVTLLIGVPMLVCALVMHRRGSIRGTLVLSGALTWMLYVYGSMAIGTVAYTDIFLVHVALFGTSLWALFLLLTGVDLRNVTAQMLPGMPQRGLAIFLIASGAVTTIIWLMEPVSALFTGDLPESLGVSTTLVTYALDIAIIAPATLITGRLVLLGRPAGWLLAVPILVLEAMLAPMMIAQTVFQLDAGVDFAAGQVIVIMGGFMALSLVAGWMIRCVFRHIEDPVGWRLAGYQHQAELAR